MIHPTWLIHLLITPKISWSSGIVSRTQSQKFVIGGNTINDVWHFPPRETCKICKIIPGIIVPCSFALFIGNDKTMYKERHVRYKAMRMRPRSRVQGPRFRRKSVFMQSIFRSVGYTLAPVRPLVVHLCFSIEIYHCPSLSPCLSPSLSLASTANSAIFS